MRHVWQNELRRISRSREVLFDEAPVVSGEYTEIGMTRKLLVSEVRAAVDSLPAIWREMIVMRDMEDLSYAEIAAILGCPLGTVMSRLARAREALRQLLMPRVPEVRR
jgi:RNA polymerase sigma-70 factor (ECF subfamily)